MLKRLDKRGDTIVEVLLAIAVVSAVLGGAFVATNRSLGGVRQSQERGEALKLVEGQLERLKESVRTDTNPPVFTTPTNPFCLNDSLAVQNTGNPACNQGRYRLDISRSASGDTYTFVARATWDRLSGGQDQVNIRYRAYRP
jgi:type II secretory pathway pseudopilin PulG